MPSFIFNLIECLDPFLKFLLLLTFLRCSFTNKSKYKYIFVITVLSSILYKFLLEELKYLTNSDVDSFYIYLIVTLASAIIWSLLILEGTYKLMLVFILFFYNSILFITIFCISLFYWMNVLNSPIAVLCSKILSYCILLLIVITFKKIKINPEIALSTTYWLVIISSQVTTFISLLIWHNFIDSSRLFFISGCLIITNLSILFIFIKILTEYEARLHYKQITHKLESQISILKNNVHLLDKLKKQQHETNNTYFCIEALLTEKRYDDLVNYMRDIVGAQDEFEDEIKTGNSLVNMVLTQKLAAAKNKNIPVTLIADLQENIPIKEDDVCGILFNLLDNAIEASAGYEQADIRIELKIIKNYLSILIKNKTSYNILKENPNLETIKTDKENHGIGINIINDIVKRNHGILDIRMEEDYFVVSALLGLR